MDSAVSASLLESESLLRALECILSFDGIQNLRKSQILFYAARLTHRLLLQTKDSTSLNMLSWIGALRTKRNLNVLNECRLGSTEIQTLCLHFSVFQERCATKTV